MQARQEENHWQRCWRDGKPDRNINLKFTIMKLKCRKWRHHVKSFELKKRALYQVSFQMETNHRHSHAIHLYLRKKTFVANFDPFLPFFLSTSRISIVLSHLLFILSVKYWKYSSIIPLSTLRHKLPRTAHAEWRESLDPSCMITEYQMFTDVWQEFHMILEDATRETEHRSAMHSAPSVEVCHTLMVVSTRALVVQWLERPI